MVPYKLRNNIIQLDLVKCKPKECHQVGNRVVKHKKHLTQL